MLGIKKDIFERLVHSNRNLIINGDISSGKTSNIIFPMLDKIIDNEESFLFLDSKEEYINKYYGYLKNKEYNIVIINLQNPDRTDGFNILYYPYTLYKRKEFDKSLEYLESIAQNIFMDESSMDSYWIGSCCDVFIGLCLLLFENAKEEEINLKSINYLVDSPNIKDYILGQDKKATIYSCLSGTYLAPNDTKNAIISTFKQKTRKIVSKEKINNLLSKTTIDLTKITTEKTAIFVIARDDNKDLNIISSIVIEQIFKIIFDNNSSPNYNFILDNIDIINRINNLSNMLSSGIPRNIKFTIATRSLDDFNKKYGEYIDKLCNIVNINNSNIEVMLDNKYEKIRYSITAYNYPKDNINYPIINQHETRVFMLKSINNSFEKDNNQDKKSNNDIPKNPFIEKQDDNIFLVYEGNKKKQNNIKEKDKSLNKENKKIEDSRKKEESSIYKINKKIEQVENETKENNNISFNNIISSEKTTTNNYKFNNSTDELIRIIDKKIADIEKKAQDDFNVDVFPQINDNQISKNNVFPTINKNNKRRIKNKLAHKSKSINIEEKIEDELEKLGFIKYIDGKKYLMNGYNKKKQELLKQKYNYNDSNNKSIF